MPESVQFYTKKDLEEFQKLRNKYLRELTSIDSTQQVTIKETIHNLIRVTEPLVEAGALPECKEKKMIASYLWNELRNQDIKLCDESWFYEQFSAEQKIERKQISTGLPKLICQHDLIKLDSHTKKCSKCRGIEHDGVFYESVTSIPREESKHKDRKPSRAQNSIIYECFDAIKEYLREYMMIVHTMENHCNDPLVLKDFEESLEWKDIAEMCLALQELYVPTIQVEDKLVKAGMHGQIEAELNVRAIATPIQLALCKFLISEKSFRKWAHVFGVSPRQFQRIRNRLEHWPKKDAKTVIERINGSLSCGACGVNLITGKRKGDNSKRVHPKYKNLNTIEYLEAVFSGKIKLSDRRK